jgi:hypothetical protein
LLAGFRGDDESPVIDKVRKLFVKGNDSAVTEEESELFLKKAHEIMARHSIDMRLICGSDRLFLPRPVGPLRKQWPSWEGSLSALVAKFYGVERIILRAYVYNEGLMQYMSLYGEPSNLDIAEYVYCAILNVGEMLYRRYLAERKAEHSERVKKWKGDVSRINKLIKENPSITRYFPPKPHQSKKASKAAFMSGLLSGYERVLEEKHEAVLAKIEAEEGESHALLLLDDPMLKEAYHKEYPRLCTRYGSYSFGAGRNAGYDAGRNMRIRTGVASGAIGTRGLIGA